MLHKNISQKTTILSEESIQAGVSISSIPAIAVQNAVGAEEIDASNQEQVAIINRLVDLALGLTEISSKLQENIIKFMI